MKKNIFIFQLTLLISTPFLGQTYLPSVLGCGEVLTITGSPYIIDTSITIAPGCSLTVDPGVEIKMAENTHLIVKGKVSFLGTAAQPVYIHAKDTIWGNILLDSALNQKSTFDYVIFENARYSVYSQQEPGAIYGYYSTLEVKNCRFKNNLRCISLYQCPNILIKDCILDSTNTGEKIHGQYCNGAVIDGCTLRMTFGDNDNIDFDASNNISFTNNYLYGGGDDGFDIGQTDSIGCDTVIIEGNYIFNLLNKGVSDGEYCMNVNINHNVIVGCGLGIGAKSGAHVVADHNTLFHNRVGVNSYNHLNQIWGPGHLTVTNCIIADSDTAWNVDSTAFLSISYSLANDTLLPGTGNITGNPMFIYPVSNPNGDFHILPGSAAIDMGDPAFANDPDGSSSDIGRFFFDQSLGIQADRIKESDLIYPNPSYGEFTLRLTPNHRVNRFIIINSLGKTIQEKEFFGDRTEYLLDLSAQASGVYYLRLLSDRNSMVKKIVIY